MTNYYENPRLSYSKLKVFNNLYRNNNIHLWDKLQDKKESKAMERGTIIHRMMDINDKIELVHLPQVDLNTGKEPTILAQIIEEMDDEVNIEALVARIYNDNYSKPKEDAYKPFFEKIKDYLTNILEFKLDKNKYIVQDETLYWECINTVNELVQAEKRILDLDILESKTVLREFSEMEIYWEYEGVKCKSKLDKVYLLEDNGVLYPIIIDYKIISQGVNTTLFRFNYVAQLSFYRLALEYWLKENYGYMSTTTVQCYLLMSNPEYADVTTVRLSSIDNINSIEGGYVASNQVIEKYYDKLTDTKYFDDWKVVAFKHSIGLLNVINTYNKEYYVGIKKLVKEYNEHIIKPLSLEL